ncbi:RNA polymerase sigma factor [Streptomyces xanthophaeus]|uniref:RNA polymerase sigma factor n=1 Tax=Streptomyces xanthophaeus TaxID=67385 RepID=UPI0036C2BDFB
MTRAEAFEEFLEHRGFLRNYLRRRSVNESMIEDVLTEVAMRYTERRPERDIDKPRAYLTMSARHALNDFYRTRIRQSEVLIGDDWELLPEPVSERSAEDTVVQNQLHEELLLKVKSLPVRQRETILLIYVQGLSNTEAAEELGVKVEVLRRTHLRALDKLRELYRTTLTRTAG